MAIMMKSHILICVLAKRINCFLAKQEINNKSFSLSINCLLIVVLNFGTGNWGLGLNLGCLFIAIP